MEVRRVLFRSRSRSRGVRPGRRRRPVRHGRRHRTPRSRGPSRATSVLTVPVDEGRLVHRHPGSSDSCGPRWRTVTAKALHSIEGKLIMLLAHAVTLAEARSYIAALADEAATFDGAVRSEEHTSELQSLMRISYAVFCLKKKKVHIQHN